MEQLFSIEPVDLLGQNVNREKSDFSGSSLPLLLLLKMTASVFHRFFPVQDIKDGRLCSIICYGLQEAELPIGMVFFQVSI